MSGIDQDPGDETAGSGVSLELYLRSLGGGPARPQQETAADRLDRLAAAGVIHGYTIIPWGDGISPSGSLAETDAGRFILERIEAFETWADRAGVTLPFECRESRTTFVDEGCEEIVLPQMTLATLDGDQLVDVVPFTDDGESYTVDDRLLAHERGEPWEWSGARPVSAAASPDADAESPIGFDR